MFINILSIIKHRAGNIIKPSGIKKYGGNNSEVKKPSNKNKMIFNLFFLFLQFQFFCYLISKFL